MISLIVAVAENGVIGDRNALLWHISEDLRHFKAVTTSWITISTAESNTVVITSLTVHFFFSSINPFLRFLLIYTTVKNPSIHADIICNANKTIVSTDALFFLFTT